MADIADTAEESASQQLGYDVGEIRKRAQLMPTGTAGDCVMCGEHYARLVHGNCARCRDQYGLP